MRAQQGDVAGAMEMYRQSLALREQVGDVQGKSVTLGNMAGLAYEAGDRSEAARLTREAVSSLAQAHAYLDLLTGLGNLSVILEGAGEKRRVLAQAVWLAIALEAFDSLSYLERMLKAAPEGSPLQEMLVAAALQAARRPVLDGKPDPERAETALRLQGALAQQKGIAPEAVQTFATDFIERAPKLAQGLVEALDGFIGDSWVFDRGPVIEVVADRLRASH